ncbi:glycoside hydrolase family 6 protein [Galbitalea soli]|uniref:Glucanase n=1 Tax=Galbitalea soli TaxID=1268042 RepID=A0A7C9TS08_9MICO|nr:glycoside hydrolase family 6 protein [Galbitalea soli]NEM91662.1 glycoside hydrolase family 6 protein [Galbitalea soli]NYJ30358.1 endoglucanase [Galbitalea soli]
MRITRSTALLGAFIIGAATLVAVPLLSPRHTPASSSQTSAVRGDEPAATAAPAAPTAAPAPATATPRPSRSAPSPLPTMTLTSSTGRWQDTATATEIYAGGLWRNPRSQPAQQVTALLARGDTTTATQLTPISSQPIATWLTDGATPSITIKHVQEDIAAATAAHRTAVFVTYAIPNRDCGGYSAGGFSTSTYLAWNASIASALAGHHAVVLIEPDSIAMLGQAKCASVATSRLALLRSVVHGYASHHIDVYLDGGNSHWVKPDVMASRLQSADVAEARGFFTNVSNFYTLTDERNYAGAISSRIGNKHFVIDISRNGRGWLGTWCNPPGAGLGANPHLVGSSHLDAALWVKTPGSSDGTCNGGPPAGTWWTDYAEALVRNRG